MPWDFIKASMRFSHVIQAQREAMSADLHANIERAHGSTDAANFERLSAARGSAFLIQSRINTESSIFYDLEVHTDYSCMKNAYFVLSANVVVRKKQTCCHALA